MRVALLSFPLVLLGCVDDTPETLTVVVEANRARAQADQARLAEMQRAVDEARGELVRTREDLTVLREKLVAAGVMSVDEAKKLEEKERSLAAREAALPASQRGASPAAPGLTRADVEALLSAQETRLASLIAAVPVAESAPVVGKATKEEVEALLAELARDRDARGLHVSDMPRGRERLACAEAQRRRGRTDGALATARALSDETARVKVDIDFVKKKYARASGLLPTLGPGQRDQAKALLGEVPPHITAGNTLAASRALTAVLALAE